MTIKIIQGDITDRPVDAIVNAANERMLGGGGVDGAIHRAAGPELLAACREVAEVTLGVRCPTGQARITPGFRLPAKWVIHTVGPVWHGGTRGEPQLLRDCYATSLQLAMKYDARSIAFPCISCGIYGYPIELAAEVAVGTIGDFLRGSAPQDSLKVELVAFAESAARVLRNAVGE